jgi:branched-subunit amino acid aminotransferase/4-amino-4-deoxychorismate lyase
VHATVGQVSVYDSGFMLGDGMWEGVRLHQGVLAFVDAHVDRLFENLKAVDIDLCLTKPEVIELVRMLGPLAGLGGAGQGMALENDALNAHTSAVCVVLLGTGCSCTVAVGRTGGVSSSPARR